MQDGFSGKRHHEVKGRKRYNGGSSYNWQKPHRSDKIGSHGHRKMEPGDRGIWATCSMGMEGIGTKQLLDLFEEYAEKFYNLSVVDNGEEEEDNKRDENDIEASIKAEMVSLKNFRTSTSKLFQPIYIDQKCVLFFKLNSLIDPVDFVDRICKSIENNDAGKMKTQFINRLTPVSLLSKATEKGIEGLSGQVLSRYFKVNHHLLKNSNETEVRNKDQEEDGESIETSFTYAIRPTIRNHNTLRREKLIKQIASYISDFHKVNLTNPDKVIIVEVFMNICGMSVVDGKDWGRLKHYNLAELYSIKAQSST